MGTLVRHFWLMFTLRHDGQGLAVPNAVWFNALVALSALVSFLRFGEPASAGVHGAFIVAVAMLCSQRVAIGYALLSTGIDLIAIPAAWVSADAAGFFTIWEALALGALGLRAGRRKRSE